MDEVVRVDDAVGDGMLLQDLRRGRVNAHAHAQPTKDTGWVQLRRVSNILNIFPVFVLKLSDHTLEARSLEGRVHVGRIGGIGGDRSAKFGDRIRGRVPVCDKRGENIRSAQ